MEIVLTKEELSKELLKLATRLREKGDQLELARIDCDDNRYLSKDQQMHLIRREVDATILRFGIKCEKCRKHHPLHLWVFRKNGFPFVLEKSLIECRCGYNRMAATFPELNDIKSVIAKAYAPIEELLNWRPSVHHHARGEQ